MQKYVIALYIRLSIEDYKYDSLSIENQSLVLHEYAASLPEALNAEIMEFIDNGYSGTNFERPQVQKLIELVRANQIDCIIVKDFSRFGRNSIETGYFIERVFPLFHTRFISISDDFDSSKFKGDTGGMDMAFKYLISEYYSRDMSIKTKSAKYAKMQRGEYQSKICPYGYRKSADGRMEPDPDAAAIVQLIFSLSAGGMNAAAITRELFRRNIPTPGQYKAARGNHTHDISRCHGIWSASTILRILEDERYTGVYVIGKRAVLEVGGSVPDPDAGIQTYLLGFDVMEFFRRISTVVPLDSLRYGLDVILEESFEDTASVFPKEREFLFSSLERLKTEDIFEQYSPDSPLCEEPIFSIPASSYHFIAHIFADTIMVDRDVAIRYLRYYPLRREVKGITRALVEAVLRTAPPESSVADKAAAVPLCERSPQDEKLVFRIPGAFWKGRPDAAVRDAMKEKYPLAVIAHVLLYWCGPQKSETSHKTPQGRKTHVGRLLAGKEYRDDKSYRNLMDMLLKEAETYTIIKA